MLNSLERAPVCIDVELSDLREAMIEQLVDELDGLTSVDVKAWLEGADDKQLQIMTDDDVIEDILDSNYKADGEKWKEGKTVCLLQLRKARIRRSVPTLLL
ncbi:hypothetical protein FQR65_LT03888 [Abscondita terminalis]|nr:hypothetical protein FQR65_LT03888 [Abscondita terminalis]